MWRAHGGSAWKQLCHHRDVLGTVGRCGVSVGSCEEALACLADRNVQHIQLPVNLLDYRWKDLPRFEAGEQFPPYFPAGMFPRDCVCLYM